MVELLKSQPEAANDTPSTRLTLTLPTTPRRTTSQLSVVSVVAHSATLGPFILDDRTEGLSSNVHTHPGSPSSSSAQYNEHATSPIALTDRSGSPAPSAAVAKISLSDRASLASRSSTSGSSRSIRPSVPSIKGKERALDINVEAGLTGEEIVVVDGGARKELLDLVRLGDLSQGQRTDMARFQRRRSERIVPVQVI